MEEKDFNDISKVLLAALVDELGGVVELDAEKLLAEIKANRIKQLSMRIEAGKAIVEVFEEDEGQEVI